MKTRTFTGSIPDRVVSVWHVIVTAVVRIYHNTLTGKFEKKLILGTDFCTSRAKKLYRVSKKKKHK